MRKSFILSGACMLLLLFTLSCTDFGNNHNTSISVSENERTYKLSANFSRNKTKTVHEYMDKKLNKYTELSFVNSEIDGDVRLNNGATFYVKSLPGKLEIELDKRENSTEAYAVVKDMCSGIKDVVKD